MSMREEIGRRLACSLCRSGLIVEAERIRCSSAGCEFQGGLVRDTVVVGAPAESFFDQRHQLIVEGNQGDDIRCLCYEAQARRALASVRPGGVVLDVGCGPSLPYEKPAGAFVIGLDASFPSVAANRQVDLRMCGSATRLALPDASVDTVLCFYSVHHLVGTTVAQNEAIVASAFGEFRRVLRSGGDLLVFEVSPWLPVYSAQRVGWNAARRLLGPRLDMFFWSPGRLERMGRETLGPADFERVTYRAPLTATFPPAFALPWLRVPRFLYPFHISHYRWRLE